MSETKQVKVDNWGIYFLQRLKHFFNRTDYCDLTLQFQDNAQLKVHRLVLNACTEYFEILERTCEMYEDCLIMPDDLQADVVVPIVNFMYTGQLEFKQELLEKLYQTSQVMNMPVLTKLLDAQRKKSITSTPLPKKPPLKRIYNNTFEAPKSYFPIAKKPYQKQPSPAKTQQVYYKNPTTKEVVMVKKPKDETAFKTISTTKQSATKIKPRYTEPKPTRYEVPEELDPDTLYDDSFTDLSYESRPLMIHPETSKRYQRKKSNFGIFNESSSKHSFGNTSLDIVECKKIATQELFIDPYNDHDHTADFDSLKKSPKASVSKVSNFFDEETETSVSTPKVYIDDKEPNNKNIDHAKIISEVLKKYPHLMKKNKNIKLKILDTPTKVQSKIQNKKPQNMHYESKLKIKEEKVFESEVLDSKEAARLISLGAENVKGPWICLICGAPGKALNFVSYYKFRRHLIEVHQEKEIPSMCEYCGLKSTKRNYMLHHLYSKHDIPPPAMYHFPKCKHCSYIGLTPAMLVKHEASHSDNKIFTCNTCHMLFKTTNALLAHMQRSGHKYSADRKQNLQCVYCMKTFVRENNFYAHLKTCHKAEAQRDGIVDDSDEDEVPLKYEAASEEINNTNEIQYNIEQSPDGKYQVTKSLPYSHQPPQKQKLLNESCDYYKPDAVSKPVRTLNMSYDDNEEDVEEGVQIDQEEIGSNEEFILGGTSTEGDQMFIVEQTLPIDYEPNETEQEVKEPIQGNNSNQIQFIVENDEEYKAMVSSGQPIIYDTDGNATKTLAVLTTPESGNYSQGTTIDLNNTSNEMMLFQDGYPPINVTESVSENQNIVLVYSHALDNGSNPLILNQGQFISSEGINAQYIPSKAVITSDFQTLAKPNTTVTEQINIQQWQGNTTSVTSANQEQTVYTASTVNEMIDPNIQYVQQQEVIQSDQTPIQNTPSEVLIISNNGAPTSENVVIPDTTSNESDSLPPVTIDNQLQVLQQQNSNQVVSIQTKLPSLQQFSATSIEPQEASKVNIEMEQSEDTQPSTELHIEGTEIPVSVNTEATSEEPETSINISSIETNNVEHHPVSDITQTAESPTYTQQDTENIQEVISPAVPRKVIEKIQTLTSEWSEEEDELESDKNRTSPSHIEQPQEDTEESIENIQKELNNQMSKTLSKQTKNQSIITIYSEEKDNTKGNNTPPEKISSLLNDWEENDSHDENSPQEENSLQDENCSHKENCSEEENIYDQDKNPENKNDSQEEIDTQLESSSQEEIDTQVENGTHEENDDEQNTELQTESVVKLPSNSKEVPNIKSLVSDWEEDEEVKE